MRNTPVRKSLVSIALAGVASLCALGATCTPGPSSFWNFETPTIHPLDLTPDRNRLLVVNLPDGRLEVLDASGAGLPAKLGSVPVGVDPVSVRARTNTEAWVVNHVSDSVSVVDLLTMNVVATIFPGDEPTDVVFAGNPQRAFVSVSQENKVMVYDPENLGAAPLAVPIAGEDPRALATDGTRVYAAIFESGNDTTGIPPEVVSDPSGPYGGLNPPPNTPGGFVPAMAPDLPPPPGVAQIVGKDALGRWIDSAGKNWSALVGWDIHDHDVAVIPAANPAQVSYVSGLMNLDMALAVTNTGKVAVVGTDATNVIRFEPNLKGTFARQVMATFDPAGGSPTITDLNPHLTYATGNVAQSERNKSLAEPRAVAWSATANQGYVAGLGSNNVLRVDGSGAVLARLAVGQGPAGLVLDEARQRLFVLNRFSSNVSVVSTASFTQTGTVSLYDPTPAAIKTGRPLLYDAHRTSGLGQASCSSCHSDARMDQIAWDLGDPSGTVKAFDQTCIVEGMCAGFHPMKGPMTTQTLIGIVGVEPLHWRGDRNDLAEFAGAFVSLLGDDAQPSATEMQQFEDFLATTHFPPNPYRNLDGTTRDETLWSGGNPRTGEHIYFNDFTDGTRRCNDCHLFPNGTNTKIIPASFDALTPGVKVAHLRNLYEKTGLLHDSLSANRGFGFLHDGTGDKVAENFARPGFTFPPGEVGFQQRKDVEAFVFSFATDTHAAIGQQVTLDAATASDTAVLARLDQLVAVVDGAPSQLALVVKGRIDGVQRGAYYLGSGTFQTDLAGETIGLGPLESLAGAGSELTLTVVPYASRIRIGVDRDEDGKLDRDEILAGTDPANPAS
ncbi:MAG: hypothetical protein IPK07_12245 [Deltaproteobacteria bacterium]|nr:hypothetical protein [Deltaproteobacteria bacterium]